ncbi:hypothetical protein DRN85_03865 [Methanosarcinales archaeon]|nr:MAG: hypothetical protein DRN85_03865 [Methanosarcinales archaeon]
METSVAIAKEADAKKGFSHTMSDNIIHRAQNEPEMQLGSLRGVIGNIRSNGSTPSVDSIATQLSSMHTAQRAPVLSALQQTHGNQYVQRVVSGIQAKLAVGQPGDKYEQEADRVAEQVMRVPDSQIMSREDIPKIVRKRSIANSPEVHPDIESEINTQQGNGQPLPDHTRTFFEPRFGYDFGGVRIHTDAHADKFNRALGARAFTLNQDIYISKQDANLNSQEGQRLLAHELTHVVQQNAVPSSTQREMIQCTEVGDILDAFFSTSTRERIWIMNESDPYTVRVRRWQPVINALEAAKRDLEGDCENWRQNHMTDSSWRPGPTDPPVTDPNAWDDPRRWVASPPGTDPTTAGIAYAIYRSTGIQTDALYTSAIGSFGIYVTANNIDCAHSRCRLQIWMYNAMDRTSFGRYARYFPGSGMARQYMWWNWVEEHNWGSTPGSGSGRSSGGGGGWQ